MFKVRHGQVLYEKGGRPRLVDEELVEVVRNYIIDNEDISDENLKQYIRQEYDFSHKRKKNEAVDDEEECDDVKYKIKRHALYRFVRKLRDATYADTILE